jgi:hypothetical protein
MLIYVDLDNTLCFTEGTNYHMATPIYDRINKINQLFDLGNKITIWTARGSGSGIDYQELTRKQLDRWGVKYHELSIGIKPVYDILIDDKNISLHDFDKGILDEHRHKKDPRDHPRIPES